MAMPERKLFLPFLCAAGSVLLLAGCTVGPNYVRASAPTTAKWDVAGTVAGERSEGRRPERRMVGAFFTTTN